MDNQNKKDSFLPISIFLSAIIIAGAWIYTSGLETAKTEAEYFSEAENDVGESVTIPVKWGDLGMQMVNAGVIDQAQFESLYFDRGGLDSISKKLLSSASNGNLTMTPENTGFVLNLLWAFGLSNKNNILERGPMSDPQYGSPAQLASVGGWTIAKGDAISHYSKHPFVVLTPEQQNLVERVAKNIYRPCCNNSTYFPDCNHGMAMLGLLELMAVQNMSENEMYEIALKANSLWFPDNYANIAKYFESRGLSMDQMNAKEILGANFSSTSGYKKMMSQMISPALKKSGGSCGV